MEGSSWAKRRRRDSNPQPPDRQSDFGSTADVGNYPESNSFASRNKVFGEIDGELQEMPDFLFETGLRGV